MIKRGLGAMWRNGMGDSSLTLRFAPDEAALAVLPERLARFGAEAALPPGLTDTLALICDELAANIVHHGAEAAPPPSYFAIRVDRRPDGLAVLVEDNGQAFDPLSAPVPDLDESVEDRPIGGLGLHLVRTLVQEIRYERANGVNRLHLVMGAQ